MSQIGFNTSDYEPSTGGKRTVFPAGDYIMLITGDEFRQTKNGDGTGFLVDWQICDGDRAGERLRNWINYENPSKQCEEIGRGEIRAIADACGVLNPKATEQLYNIPMLVTLGVEYKQDKETGEEIPANNTFEKFQSLSQQPAAQPSAPSPQTDSQPGTAPKPAWER